MFVHFPYMLLYIHPFLLNRPLSPQVLAIYFVGIMVVLPVVVATWWWNSKKYTRDHLLRQTINLYYQYLRPQMPMRGVFLVELLIRFGLIILCTHTHIHTHALTLSPFLCLYVVLV